MKKIIMGVLSFVTVFTLASCQSEDLSKITAEEAIAYVSIQTDHYSIVNDNNFSNKEINQNKSLAEASGYTKEDYKNVQFQSKFYGIIKPSGFTKTLDVENLFSPFYLVNPMMGGYNFYPNQVNCDRLYLTVESNHGYDAVFQSISFKILVDDSNEVYLSKPYDYYEENELTIMGLDRTQLSNPTQDSDGYVTITAELLGGYNSLFIYSHCIHKLKDITVEFTVQSLKTEKIISNKKVDWEIS